MSTTTFPVCPSCERTFAPGIWWDGANYCRGVFLLGAIYDNPGLSAWELSERTGMPYRNVTSGLQKLRQWSSVDIVQAESEERDSGGIRYRYFPILDIRESDNARADFERACQGQEARYRQNPWA